MKKLILTLIISFSLIPNNSKAAMMLVFGNLATYQNKNFEDYATATAVTSAILGMVSGLEIFITVYVLDINYENRSYIKQLNEEVPELTRHPEIVSDLMAMAKNGITQEVETTKGKMTINYINNDVLVSYLSETDLSLLSKTKLTQIFGLN